MFPLHVTVAPLPYGYEEHKGNFEDLQYKEQLQLQ